MIKTDLSLLEKLLSESEKSDLLRHNSPENMPNNVNEVLTEAALNAYLQAENISLRYDVISRNIEIRGVSEEYNPETLQNDLPVILHDQLKGKFKRCEKESVQDLLRVIAGKNRCNSVLEMLRGGVWDGVDRIAELYDILAIDESDTLSRLLIKKWLWQALSMARNSLKGAYGADGILVLQGKQGLGKTTLVRKLAVKQELCKLGQYVDSNDKDTARRCASAWLVELGEIETTFKSDLDRLKSFITAEIDEYRLPYGRADQKLARRTALVGTCNSDSFLVDPTGSRRFWTVPIKSIDLGRLEAFDSLQLWLRADEFARPDPQGFRLTKEEQELLAMRNLSFERPLAGQNEVLDVLSKESKRLIYRDVTVSEFKENHIELRNLSVNKISTALNKLGGYPQILETKIINGRRTTRKLRNLPVWKKEQYEE